MAVILCVDDEEIPLFLRKRVLENAGHKVCTAVSGGEALELFSQRQFDLILSDQLMPGMTGTELARIIKKSHPNLPVILISGINEAPPDVTCVDLFISKLEGPDALCLKIEHLLQSSRQRTPIPDAAAG